MTKPENAQKLWVVPCSKERAAEFITYHHRHHLPLDFASYCLAVCTAEPLLEDGSKAKYVSDEFTYTGIVHGVAMIGRTTTQYMTLPGIPNEWILEVRRVATDGFPNACSALYGAAWRFVREMGYWALISYTLPEESGASLRALGWECVEDVGGNSWAHRGKRGYDIHPTGKKLRWQITQHWSKCPPFKEIKFPVYDGAFQNDMFNDAPKSKGEGVGAKIKKQSFIQTGFFDNPLQSFGVEYVPGENNVILDNNTKEK